MPNPLDKYMMDSIPRLGSGNADEYFGDPVKLDSLIGGRPSFIPADQPYDESLDLPNLLAEGVPLEEARGLQVMRQRLHEAADRQKSSYDEGWATHFLSHADPTSSGFSDGLVRLFEQFPRARKSPQVMQQVQFMQKLADSSHLLPKDVSSTITDIYGVDPEDPEAMSKIRDISRENPDVMRYPHVMQALTSMKSRVESARQRSARLASQEMADIRKHPEAYARYSEMVKRGDSHEEALDKTRSALAFEPKDYIDRVDYWKNHADDPEGYGRHLQMRSDALEKYGASDDDLQAMTDPETGRIDMEAFKTFRNHQMKENPSKPLIQRNPRSAGILNQIEMLAQSAVSPDALHVALTKMRGHKQGLTLADDLENARPMDSKKAFNEEEWMAREHMKDVDELQRRIATMSHALTSPTYGASKTEVANLIAGLGLNPAAIGIEAPRWRGPFAKEEEQPEPDKSPTLPKGVSVRRIR